MMPGSQFPSFGELVAAVRRNGAVLVEDVRRQRRLIWTAFGALLAAVVVRALEPWPLKFVFDWLLTPEHGAASTPAVLGLGGQYSPEAMLAGLVTAMMGLVAVRAVLGYLATVRMARAAANIAAALRSRVFEHLQTLSVAFHDRRRSADLVTRVTHDIGRSRDVAATALVPLAANGVACVVMIGVMFWLSVDLAVVVMLLLPLFGFVAVRASRRIHHSVRGQRRREAQMASSVAEALGAIRVVQAMSIEQRLQKVFARQSDRGDAEGVASQRLAAALARQIEMMFALATALVVWRGATLVMSEAISPGTLLVFVSYLGQIFRPMRQSAKHLTALSKAYASLERVGEILSARSDVVETAHPRVIARTGGDIRFEGVSFRYRGGQRYAVRDVNLHVRPGSTVAIVGASGAGKSTLLSLLLRLYDPEQGRILLDGEDITSLSLADLRAQFSVVLQESTLLGVSIRDNIAFGKAGATHEEVVRAARMARVDEFVETLERGYDTLVGERGACLSGGQRQRLALARAIVRDAPVLMLDEPTTGLDDETFGKIMATLQTIWRDKTTIVVTHDPRILPLVDRIAVMADGELLDEGGYDELVERCSRFNELFAIHAGSRGARQRSLR